MSLTTPPRLVPTGVRRATHRARWLAFAVAVGLLATTIITTGAAPGPPPSWTVLRSESWGGANFTPWPSVWSSAVGQGGLADTRSGYGRLLTNRPNAWAHSTAGGVATAKDLDVVTAYQWNQTTATAQFSLFLRGSGGWQNAYRPLNGYGVELAKLEAVNVVKNVNGVRTIKAVVPNGSRVTTAKQWLRFRVQGQQLMFRSWPDGTAEPASWAYSSTDTSVSAAGRLFTSLVHGSASGTVSVGFDNLTLSTLGTTTTTTAAPTTTTTTAPAGWRLYWSDEFNGTSLSSAWRPYHNDYGTGNREIHCYTPSNVSVAGGTMTIQSRRQQYTCPDGGPKSFTSGFLGTRDTGTYFPRYGRYEMRAKLPHVQGIWPGFWLRHRNGAGAAETDIMEYFHAVQPGKAGGSLHLDGRYNLSKKAVLFETPTATPGWHTWAVEIEPVGSYVRFTFLLDNVAYHSYTDTQHHWATSAPTNATWDIAVNASVGGDWNGHPDDPLGYLRDLNRCAQGVGTPPNACQATGIRRAVFPISYQVDYVRVYTR